MDAGNCSLLKPHAPMTAQDFHGVNDISHKSSLAHCACVVCVCEVGAVAPTCAYTVKRAHLTGSVCVEREKLEDNQALERRRLPREGRGAMAILFAVVARGTTILAKNAWCGGNFLEVTEQILSKIPSENNKLTYSHGNYLFHYICQERIIYLCITDDDFERSRAFTFLNEIKKRFQTTYGSRAQTALPYAMNSEFSSVLAAQMKHLSENKKSDRVLETQAQVDELKGIMVRNIDLVAQRGEKLELLIDKTENLVDSSVTFKTTSRNLARAMCMKNLKLTIIIAIVAIVVVYIIVSAACGGLSWPTCIKK